MGAAVRRRSWFGWALFSSGSAHERRHLLACVRGCYRAMKNALRLEVTDKFKLFFSFFLPPPPPPSSILYLTVAPAYELQRCLFECFQSVPLQSNAALVGVSSI